jgi:enoyl-CoA hydratase
MLAGRAPLALSEAKASIRDADILPIDEHIVAERRRFILLLGTADKKEGIAAFREKRAPLWQGR